ncbi:MAG TPA: metallopeptidase family protein [Acidimicrobiales bacterium]|nr:metallopeptidase family protein [Acidimicrobiales bacterium]
MVDVTAERFEELVADALDAIPPELGRYMDNVAVFVDDRPPGGLYGLYQGVPLTHREGYGGGGMVMPDRITIFRQTICRDARSEADVVAQVRKTVVHEVAHHFGISDQRLTELGYG